MATSVTVYSSKNLLMKASCLSYSVQSRHAVHVGMMSPTSQGFLYAVRLKAQLG